MSRILVITNPVAARTTEEAKDRVVATLSSAGWSVDRESTTCAADTYRLAVAGVADGVDAVAVFGGDGTSMQAAAAVVGTEVALALIPGGTGNVLAGNLRIPMDPIAAVRSITVGRRRRIDLGEVTLADGAHYFGVACGAGVDARVMGETLPVNKRRWGIGAYFATTFRVLSEIQSTACTITVDGKRFEAPAALILILNCAEVIPHVVRVRPEIRLDDGILDLVVVAADSAAGAIRGFLRVLGNSVGTKRETPYLRYARGSEFRIEPADSLPVQFDGDPVGTTPFGARVLPGALTVMVPSS
jgi:YegS/Rv2252/BmrU family lipid kinase